MGLQRKFKAGDRILVNVPPQERRIFSWTSIAHITRVYWTGTVVQLEPSTDYPDRMFSTIEFDDTGRQRYSAYDTWFTPILTR